MGDQKKTLHEYWKHFTENVYWMRYSLTTTEMYFW